jgi:hypothetical protein
MLPNRQKRRVSSSTKALQQTEARNAIDEQNRFAADGTLESMIIRGKTPQGNADETYEAKNGLYTSSMIMSA